MYVYVHMYVCIFFFQAEECIRDLVRSRGLGDVDKGQSWNKLPTLHNGVHDVGPGACRLYASDAADELTRVDRGGWWS